MADKERQKRLEEAARRLNAAANAAKGSREEYISKKLAAAQAAALHMSRTREMPAFVQEYDPVNIAAAAARARGDAERARMNAQRYADKPTYKDRSQQEHARLVELREAKRYDKLADDIEAGLVKVPAVGGNCIATVTSNWNEALGGDRTIVSNRDFVANEGKNGWIEIPKEMAKPGDTVIVSEDWEDGRGYMPRHGMTLDSVHGPTGIANFNYSRGKYEPEALVRGGIYSATRFVGDDNYRAFRFVGTPADSLRWTKEWEAGKRACGGKIYADGGPEGDSSAPLLVNVPYTPDDFFSRWYRNRLGKVAENLSIDEFGEPDVRALSAPKDAAGYVESMLDYANGRKEFFLQPYYRMMDGKPEYKNVYDDPVEYERLTESLNQDPRYYGMHTMGFTFSDQGPIHNHIYYTKEHVPSDLKVHERTHALHAPGDEYVKYIDHPFENAALDIMRRHGYNDTDSNYYHNPFEVVARMNSFRFNNGLDPNHEITKDELRMLREKVSEKANRDGAFDSNAHDLDGFLNQFDDDTLIELLNGVAVAGPVESMYGNHIGNISAYGGSLFDGGGKFLRINLQDQSPYPIDPRPFINYPIETPYRFRPEPDLGDYERPVETGMIQSIPVPIHNTFVAPQPGYGILAEYAAPVAPAAPVVDLFSDEAKARRRLKQRYAESRFNNKAVSKAGAQGAWQIMPITLNDYLGRGRGKAGDLNDPEYNGKIRDWVMGIIPRDLQEFWSDDDSDINKLAKLYAAYNWGAGSLRNFLRKRQKAGKSIDDPYEWVEGLNPETRRYVKYLAFDEDIPDSSYTNTAFEDAAKAKGYMAEGGRLFEMGGPEGDSDGIHLGELQPAVKLAYEPLHVDIPYTTDDFFERWYPNRRAQLIDNMAAIRSRHAAWPFSSKKRAEKDVDGYIRSVLANNSNVKEFGVPIIGAYGSNNKFPNAFNNEEARKVLSDHLESKYRFIGKEIPEGGFDNFDLAFLEMGNAYGKSYKDNPYYIFYDRGNPSFETIVHERSHVLRPLPEDLKKYRDYRYFGNPMERKVDDIKKDLVHTDFWSGKIDKSWANSEGVDKVKDDISYLSSIEEIVARLNAIRAEQNLNPNHVITKEDLDEIRKNADEATRKEFLDLYTDEALLRFFNEVANAGEQESLYGNHLGNLSASGGKIHIKPENRGKFTALKKRTGHSASWFKTHGTPAQKKMAVFALNAKKWKHGDGGPIDRYSPEQIRAAIAKLKGMQK